MTDPQRLATSLADRYRIERELGAGGMATVYLAQDVKHDRKVAVKVLRPELAAALGAERFLQEIRVTANLQHPHILPLHDSGKAHAFLYDMMPYVEGESLPPGGQEILCKSFVSNAPARIRTWDPRLRRTLRAMIMR